MKKNKKIKLSPIYFTYVLNVKVMHKLLHLVHTLNKIFVRINDLYAFDYEEDQRGEEHVRSR